MSSLRIEGGDVLTPEFGIERADVLIDQKAGTIEQVGTGVPPGDAALDAGGCLVIPGLVNAHTHVAMTLFRGYADDKPVDAWLEEDIWPIEAELTAEDVHVGTELGTLEMIKGGTTTFCDMYFELEAIADAVDRSGMRARLGYGMVTAGKDAEAARAELARGLELATEIDEMESDRIRSAFMPHSLTTVDPEPLREILPRVRDAAIPIHFHANESRAFVDPIVEAEGVRPLEFARELGVLSAGDSLAHCVHVDETEIQQLAETGAGVVHCPASNMKLASGMAPVREMHQSGIPVGLGTDGAASNNDLDMFGELRDAAMLGKLATGDASALPAETAVRMATADGAAVTGLPGGVIHAGGAADVAVVDLSAPHLRPIHDPVSHLAYAVSANDVRHTVCDGQVLMRDRECLTLDEAAVLERADAHAATLAERAKA